MARIIFWNVNKKDLTSFVCDMTAATHSDVVVLLENDVPSFKTLQSLQTNVSKDFYSPTIIDEKKRFHCFCRNSEIDLSEVHAGQRASVRKLRLGKHSGLLALVHGVDIRNNDPETRQEFVQSLANDLSLVKEQQDTNKVVVLGDFNMNPYDRAMNLAAGFNAMMTKDCIKRGVRRHSAKDYDFYYNPMWSLFGDDTAGPSGTISDTSNQGPYGWSMLDQVLISHSLLELFDDVKILDKAGSESLMNRQGRPDSRKASDHFPILVNFTGSNDE